MKQKDSIWNFYDVTVQDGLKKNSKMYFIQYTEERASDGFLYSDLVPDLPAFMSESTPIPKVLGQESTINSVTADVWWWCMERQEAIHGDLYTVALKLVYACQFSSNWKIFFKFWDDPVQTQKQTRNIYGCKTCLLLQNALRKWGY